MAAHAPVLRTSSRRLVSLVQTRALSRSTPASAAAKDVGPGRTHHLDKNDGLDPQQQAAGHSKAERATGGTQSQATSQKDVRQSNKRGKEEHPAAPEPVIGMNEERGTKGH